VEHDLEQLKNKGCNVAICTVGRLFDLYENQHELISFKKLELLIMDEADRLLLQGHEVKLTTILNSLPKQRRTGLFSATMTSQIKNLVKIGMRNPYFVDVQVYEGKEMFGKKFEKEAKGVTVQSFDNKALIDE